METVAVGRFWLLPCFLKIKHATKKGDYAMKVYTPEDIEMFNKLLDLNMSEERKKAVLPTYQDWITRAEAMDKKMSQKGFRDILPCNIFKHGN